MRTYQIFTGGFGLLMAGVIFYLVRRDHMHARFSLWWLMVGMLAAAFGFFPGWVDVVGRWLGVAYPPVLGIILVVGAIVLKILFIDIEQSRMRREMLRLTQRLLLVEERLRQARLRMSSGAVDDHGERNV
jgi:hypothetical protein